MTPDPKGPTFTTRLEGRAYAHFSGPHTPDTLSFLCEYLKHEKWLEFSSKKDMLPMHKLYRGLNPFTC